MKPEYNIYIAGPLFTEAEVFLRNKMAAAAKEIFEMSTAKDKFELNVFNPLTINETIEDPQVLKHDYFYQKDISFLDKTNLLIVDIDNTDSGTMLELGYLFYKHKNLKSDLKIVVFHSDWRDQMYYLERVNRFVNGLVFECNYEVKSFEELCTRLGKIFNKL
ncbi:Nucleoside 2-deoxyribosyltransferase [Metamycoplasma arthritidis]|uniref:Nucleoside 2-deoxyribosyltransferase n=1 Tax=Metamycoplasma arthritidis (strain 158L3-1) TaxID=243272 RepID=B3PMH2_META1|nr:nucleoside 2-deoxyribosyltransferase [Metamycoplasma arthritidis]ACF07224.1 nucleoside 2-deoxyribosyltransferase [Metamycoplasma arthritidis 158L3-1]VEU78748.1 Nucleoside 2-deoxyribosyltransferase [Metamycoplasma arthritidis]